MNPTKSYNTLPEAARKVCRKQPGFNRAYPMALFPTATGGIRLYAYVSGAWMDASLSDITEWAVLRLFEPGKQGKSGRTKKTLGPLAELALDQAASVREKVATNPNTPAATVELLATQESSSLTLDANQADEPQKEIFLTNSCGEPTCWLSEEDLDAAGLPYDESHFPLTAGEAAQLEEETQFFGRMWLGSYTTLWQGRKWHSPTLEFPYNDPFWGEDNGHDSEAEVLGEAELVLKEAAAYAQNRGGSAVLETDLPGRIVVRMRLPFNV